MNLVFAKHLNDKNGKGYLFEIPEGLSVGIGCIVRVSTKRGETIAECISHSFKISNTQAVKILIKELGGTFPLKRVIGTYELFDWFGAWNRQEEKNDSIPY